MSPLRNEEARQLLRRIVESMAWRQLATINTLGHCLKHVHDLDNKLRVATELDLCLRLFRDVRALYREVGWEDVEERVRDRMDHVVYPESRLEFGLAYYVGGLVEEVAMESYVKSSYEAFADIAQAYVDAAVGRPQPTRFLAFANDPSNRPQAQQYLNRWLGILLPALGRPGTPADRRAVELGLRSRSSQEMHDEFLARLTPFVEKCGLEVPAAGEGDPR